MSDTENADKRKQSSPHNAAEQSGQPDVAKVARDAMLREVDRELAELTRIIGARRLPGVTPTWLRIPSKLEARLQ